MTEERIVKISRFLSKHLRHQPDRIGLTLGSGGWVDVEALLVACAHSNMALSRVELEEVVAGNNKQRFSFDSTGTQIRANQGHSVEIDLQLEQSIPPETLYHGTGHLSVAAILREGLVRMTRHHVHLSLDRETARNVGARHGHPSIFAVAARMMHEAGFLVYCSANGVWLVDHVPPKFLTLLE